MIFIYMILTALLPTAKGLMGCDISESTKAQQCVGALGEPLIFYLHTTATQIKLTKNQTIILQIKNNKLVVSDLFTLFTNGTVKLNNALKRHFGDYLWEFFKSDGKASHEVNMHLKIQAHVSEPAVSQTCLSPEQMGVSCSSEGDEVQFILSLDDHLLMQTRTYNQSQRHWTLGTQSLATDKQEKASTSIVSISLSGQLTGNLTCRVWNNVSRDEKIFHLKSCEGFPVVTVAVITSAATLLLHVALYVGLKHRRKKTTQITVNEGNSDNEIIYSDVRVMKNTRKTRPISHQNKK